MTQTLCKPITYREVALPFDFPLTGEEIGRIAEGILDPLDNPPRYWMVLDGEKVLMGSSAGAEYTFGLSRSPEGNGVLGPLFVHESQDADAHFLCRRDYRFDRNFITGLIPRLLARAGG